MNDNNETKKLIDDLEKKTKELEKKVEELESSIKAIVYFAIIAAIVAYIWGLKVVITLAIIVAFIANYTESRKKEFPNHGSEISDKEKQANEI